MPYNFGKRSNGNLAGVHPDLVRVMREAITNSPYDFAITEGVRSQLRQQELFASGASRTLNSRHLTGHAVDIAIYDEGIISWDFRLFQQVADHVKTVSKLNDVPLVWGGDWRSLRDGPHFELNRLNYV